MAKPLPTNVDSSEPSQNPVLPAAADEILQAHLGNLMVRLISLQATIAGMEQERAKLYAENQRLHQELAQSKQAKEE